jgi:hypothetical protein
MALSKTVLGLALHNKRTEFCEKTMAQINTDYGSLANARLMLAEAEAEIIIDHFKNNIQITIPALGLISAAAGQPVTGSANTGTIL